MKKLAILLILVAGCASPRAQWAVSRATLTQTEIGLVAAHASGALSDKDFVATAPVVKAARGTLDAADKELVANNDQPTDKARFYLNLTNSTLLQLKNYGVLSNKK